MPEQTINGSQTEINYSVGNVKICHAEVSVFQCILNIGGLGKTGQGWEYPGDFPARPECIN
jgi:hypothetical protein